MINERKYTDYGASVYEVMGRELPSVSSIVGRWHSYGMERMKLRLVAEFARNYPQLEEDRVIGMAMQDGGEAARHGKEAHGLIERMLAKSERTPETKIEAGFNELTADFTILANELLLANPQLGYAGRCDFIAHVPELGQAIVDFKTGNDIYLEYALQLAAYANATHYGDTGGQIVENLNRSAAVIIHAPRNDKPMQVRIIRGLDEAWKAFQYLLQLHYFETVHSKLVAHSEIRPIPTGTGVPLEEILETFPEATVEDLLEHYADQTWEWLRSHVATYTQLEKQTLAKLWPTGVPTFKRVSLGEMPRPDLHGMALIEAAIVDTDSAHQKPWGDPLSRPLPPATATLEEAPPVLYRVDTPPVAWLIELRSLHQTLTPKEKKLYTGTLKSHKPNPLDRASCVADLNQVKQILQERTLNK